MITSERLLFLIRISTVKCKNPICIKELCQAIKISRANFTPVKKILIDNEIATEYQSFGNAKLLNINIKKLDKFIEDSEIYKLIAEYIKFKDPILHQPQ
jgi:hypothetical protein